MTDHLAGPGAANVSHSSAGGGGGGGLWLLGCTQQERSSRDTIVRPAASLEPTSMFHHVRDGYVRLGAGGDACEAV